MVCTTALISMMPVVFAEMLALLTLEMGAAIRRFRSGKASQKERHVPPAQRPPPVANESAGVFVPPPALTCTGVTLDP